VIPALILGLVAAHLALVVYHKHTQYPGPGRTEDSVVGYPVFPVYAAKAGGFFFIVFGVTTLMGALMQINPVWVVGPYNPAQVSAGSQPDWYMGFAEGAIRIMPGPGWEWHIGSTTWSWNVFIPLALPMALLFGGMALYPFIERWVTGDTGEHHLLDRPRNNPTRTGLGVAAMTAYGMLWAGGGNDLIAILFDVSLNSVTWFLRIGVFVAPVLAFLLTKRICIGLQRADHDRLLHGAETGVIERDPSGRYSERHRPIPVGEQYALTQQAEQDALLPVAGDGDGEYSDRQIRLENLRRRATRFYFADTLRKPTRAELEEAAEHHKHVAAGHGAHEIGAGQGDGHGNGHGDDHAVVPGTESEHLAP
jgi:ubiquinol-cytochrome c reductase cytochrome b subunit